MNEVVLVTKVSPTETIKNLPRGVPTLIKNKDIKVGCVKSTITNLRKQGHVIEYTEDGRIDDIIVTLLK